MVSNPCLDLELDIVRHCLYVLSYGLFSIKKIIMRSTLCNVAVYAIAVGEYILLIPP